MPPRTLFFYISARFLLTLAVLTASFTCLSLFADLVENLRYVAKVQNGGLLFALQVSAMRLPSVIVSLAPFIFLFGSLWAMHQLNRRAEISVMRSAGLSVWRLVGPGALIAALAGLALVTFIDPFAARLVAKGEELKLELRGRTSSLVRIFGDGIWLRQRDQSSVLLINAREFDPASATLAGVTMWRRSLDSVFLERIDSRLAKLSGRTIELHDARVRPADSPLDYRTPVYAVPSSLTPEDLRANIEDPEMMSAFELPRFIVLAEAAGLPTVRYAMRFHELCSTPLKLVAMVLIAAMFSLRPARLGGAFAMFIVAVVTGFGFYILSEVARALGAAGTAPAPLAAWTPALIGAVGAAWGLLNFEDG